MENEDEELPTVMVNGEMASWQTRKLLHLLHQKRLEQIKQHLKHGGSINPTLDSAHVSVTLFDAVNIYAKEELGKHICYDVMAEDLARRRKERIKTSKNVPPEPN
jgi:hypothetical protein